MYSPPIQKIYNQFMARKAKKVLEATKHNEVLSQLKHEPLELCFSYAGNYNGNRWKMLIRYCPLCLRGTPVNITFEIPEDLPLASELGVRRMKEWTSKCPEKAKLLQAKLREERGQFQQSTLALVEKVFGPDLHEQ